MLGFLGAHFLAFSPLLFLALVWAVVADLAARAAAIQGALSFLVRSAGFRVLFSAFDQTPRPRRTGTRLPSSVSRRWRSAYWHERLANESPAPERGVVGIVLGLLMSLLALDTDILRSANFHFPRRDPATGCVAGNRRRGAWRNYAPISRRKTGERLFLIADRARPRLGDRHFICATSAWKDPGIRRFTLSSRRTLQNQFSFWPRYDEFVEQPSMSRRSPRRSLHGGEAASIRSTVAARFTSRKAHGNARRTIFAPHFNRSSALPRSRSRRFGTDRADMADFSLPELPDSAVMSDCAGGFRRRAALQRGRERSDSAGGAARRADRSRLRNHFCRRWLDRSHRRANRA